MSDWGGLLWLVLLLGVNAFFVGRGVRGHLRAALAGRAAGGGGPRSARTALGAMEHATLMLSTTQLGITVALAADPRGLRAGDPSPARRPARLTGLPEDAIGAIAFVIALVIVDVPARRVRRARAEEHRVLGARTGRCCCSRRPSSSSPACSSR